MSHDLRKNTDGTYAFAYAGAPGWHELGQGCANAMTAAEAIQLAGLGWEVTKEQLYRKDGSAVENAFATVASDTNAVLGVVGGQYTPLQNRLAFDFFDAARSEGEILFETAGALGKGEKIWLLARTPENITEVIKGDPIQSFLLLSNSHDGSSGVEVRSTCVRVVCRNTHNQAINGNKPVIRLRHTRTVESRLRMAGDILRQHAETQKSYFEALAYLAKFPITDEIVNAFELEMFGDLDKTPEGRARTILSNKLEQFEHLLVRGAGTDIKGVAGTMYGMVQAYTEWADWASPVRGTDDRTNAILFGQASMDKKAALDYALVLAGR